jgi:peptide/nickel transport system substrate-binding protein
MKETDKYFNLFKAGKISRRQCIKRLIGLGLSIPAANAILMSIGSQASAATPKKGGRLRIAFESGSQKETLDPAKRWFMIDRNRHASIYNTLINATPKLTPEPALAESWEGNKTADEWTFKLRKGVEWHNGRSFRAEDVIYSYNRVIDPKTGSGGRVFLSNVADMHMDDPHTVRIKLKGPNVDFPFNLTSDFLAIVPDGFTDFDNAVGTGPFKLKSFKAGHGCLVTRNPNYFKSGLPYVDEVENFSIPDNVARANALLAGEIHLISILDPALLKKVQRSSRTKILSTPSAYRVPFIMNCTMPPYDNSDVRLALKLLIDREKYNQIVYGGNAQIGNDHPVSSIYPDYCKDIPQRQQDPEKAKSLLKKAGVLDFTFNLHYSGQGLGAAKGALVYSDMAAKAGVKIKPIQHPTDGYWDAVWLKKAFCMADWLMRATANMGLSIAFKSDSSWNDTFWKRTDFDKLLLEARKTYDKAKRKELYCAMQQMIRDDGGQMIASFPNILDGATVNVKNIILNPIATLGALRVQEACWIES